MKKLFNLCILLLNVCFWANAQDSVTDICGNKYPLIKIGNQIWMAESMRCNKYDTESESEMRKYIKKYPHFSDEYFESALYIEGNHSLLYSWDAAMGLNESEKEHIVAHDFFRQGICPNGFRLPLKEDLEGLMSVIKRSKDISSKIKSGTWTTGEGDLFSVWDMNSVLSLWSSTTDGYKAAYILIITKKSSYCAKADRLGEVKSVRCIKK